MEVSTYTTTATRTAHGWIGQCDQAPGALSDARRLDQLIERQREAIAFVTDVPMADVDVELALDVPDPIKHLLSDAAVKTTAAEIAHEQATAARRATAHLLVEQGYSMRDIGVVLGVSHQRVHQLVNTKQDAHA